MAKNLSPQNFYFISQWFNFVASDFFQTRKKLQGKIGRQKETSRMFPSVRYTTLAVKNMT